MTTATNWTDQFEGLRQLPADVIAQLRAEAKVVSLSPATRIYSPGLLPENFLLVLAGSVRVQQVSETGREIVLYRVGAGESCALTTAALLGRQSYLAEAITEDDVRAVAIPRRTFDDLIGRSAGFRNFVFADFGARVTALFRIIDEVAFARLDIRLAHRLLELSHGAATLAATQQQLASELGTTREVVSRILLEFQRHGWLTLARGSLTIVDRHGLERLSSGH